MVSTEVLPLLSEFPPGTRDVFLGAGAGAPTVITRLDDSEEKSDCPAAGYSDNADDEAYEVWRDYCECDEIEEYEEFYVDDCGCGSLTRARQALGRARPPGCPEYDNFVLPSPIIVWGTEFGRNDCPFRMFMMPNGLDGELRAFGSPNFYEDGTQCLGHNAAPRSHIEAWATYWNAGHNYDLQPDTHPTTTDLPYLLPYLKEVMPEKEFARALSSLKENPDPHIQAVLTSILNGEMLTRERSPYCHAILSAGDRWPNNVRDLVRQYPEWGEVLLPSEALGYTMRLADLPEQFHELRNAEITPRRLRLGGRLISRRLSLDYGDADRRYNAAYNAYYDYTDGSNTTERDYDETRTRLRAEMEETGLEREAAYQRMREHDRRSTRRIVYPWRLHPHFFFQELCRTIKMWHERKNMPNVNKWHLLGLASNFGTDTYNRASMLERWRDRYQPVWKKVDAWFNRTRDNLPRRLPKIVKRLRLLAEPTGRSDLTLEGIVRFFEKVVMPQGLAEDLWARGHMTVLEYCEAQLAAEKKREELKEWGYQASRTLQRATNAFLHRAEQLAEEDWGTMHQYMGRRPQVTPQEYGWFWDRLQRIENPPPGLGALGLKTTSVRGDRTETDDDALKDAYAYHLGSGLLRGLCELGVDPDELCWLYRNELSTRHAHAQLGTVIPFFKAGNRYLVSVGGKTYAGVIMWSPRGGTGDLRKNGYDIISRSSEYVMCWGEYAPPEGN
jgi:hypothetical protein